MDLVDPAIGSVGRSPAGHGAERAKTPALDLPAGIDRA